MSKDDIIAMAREADLIDFRDADDDPHTTQMVEFFERFAALVAAAEREACAKVCDAMAARCNDIRCAALEVAAENIRSRSGEKK